MSDEWYTPIPIIKAAKAVLGAIELDPTTCLLAVESTPLSLRPEEWYSKDDDALSFDWPVGLRIWMNPPYSREAGTAWPFVQRLLESDPEAAIVLVNSSTATKYFQALAKACSARCDCSPRVSFDKIEWPKATREPGGSPRYDNTIFYIGADPSVFCFLFSKFGTCYKVTR